MPKHSCDNLIRDFKNLDNRDLEALEKLELKTGISKEKLKQAHMLSIQCDGSTHLVGRNTGAAEAGTNSESATQQQIETTNRRIFEKPVNTGLVSNLKDMAIWQTNQIVETIEPPPSNGADPLYAANKLTDLTSLESIQASGLSEQQIT